MKKLKLTDEELSRVLGMAAIGKLHLGTYGRNDDSNDDNPDVYMSGCACVAGSAYHLGLYGKSELGPRDSRRAEIISGIMLMGAVRTYRFGDPDAVLRMLEERGLA